MFITLNDEQIRIGEEEDFFINEDNVDGELCKAGRILSFYGTLAADLKAQSAAAKAALESFDASLAQEIRQEFLTKKEKSTEGMIKERVVSNKERKEIINKYIGAERDFQKAENLFRSQQKKVDCVISLSYKQRTEIAKSGF
jgi:hypothetical protein